MNDTLFVNNVTHLMKKRNMSCKELGEKANLPTLTIERLLNHKLASLKLSTAVIIANAFNASLDDLCGLDREGRDDIRKEIDEMTS